MSEFPRKIVAWCDKYGGYGFQPSDQSLFPPLKEHEYVDADCVSHLLAALEEISALCPPSEWDECGPLSWDESGHNAGDFASSQIDYATAKIGAIARTTIAKLKGSDTRNV